MLSDFIMRAALAGVGTAIAAGFLGSFVVWRRMAYFGDATAHAAVLGVAIALGFQVSILGSVGVVAVLMAVGLWALTGRGFAADTVLGVLSHGALALGLLAVALVPSARVDLDTYLFGDVLTVSKTDLAVIWGGAAVVVGVLAWRWSRMLTATVSPDLAYAAGIDPRREQLILTLLLAGVVAVSIKVVGALLITALLIIPAAAARNLSRTPEAMAVIAVVCGIVAALGGVGLSFTLDTQAGPSIVCTAAALFVLSLLRRRA
ncbi:metal ABC transporter permease [Marivivens donghaensis]|uniref:metal ABC transporter permease n=1 Tax=Marivivens donghaensis TaxID=1699413 RepID=UPI00201F8830|nr:metal ABC transporter permease [Marivivens donghaensis]MCL7407787.1 metal ABC transporter permease [Marivivens donghaensis]MDN3704234.1 metal ABC transporter permease [Marivivens donghaensis]